MKLWNIWPAVEQFHDSDSPTYNVGFNCRTKYTLARSAFLLLVARIGLFLNWHWSRSNTYTINYLRRTLTFWCMARFILIVLLHIRSRQEVWCMQPSRIENAKKSPHWRYGFYSTSCFFFFQSETNYSPGDRLRQLSVWCRNKSEIKKNRGDWTMPGLLQLLPEELTTLSFLFHRRDG